jgi:hypothetical protein
VNAVASLPSLNRPYILDVDPCDCSNELADKWAITDCTVADINQCMHELAAERAAANKTTGYAKLRFTLAFVDCNGNEETLEMRIDVDYCMSESATLLGCLLSRASYWGSKRAEGSHGNPEVRAERKRFYEDAARAVAAE